MKNGVQFPGEVTADGYELYRIPGTNDYEVMFMEKDLGTVRVIPHYGHAIYLGSDKCSKMHRISLQMIRFADADFTPRLGEIKDLIWAYTIF